MLCDILEKTLPYKIVVEYLRKGSRGQTTTPTLRAPDTNAKSKEMAQSPSASYKELDNILNFLRVKLESREKRDDGRDNQQKGATVV